MKLVIVLVALAALATLSIEAKPFESIQLEETFTLQESLKKIAEVINEINKHAKDGAKALVEYLKSIQGKLDEFINTLPEALQKLVRAAIKEIMDRVNGKTFSEYNPQWIMELARVLQEMRQVRSREEAAEWVKNNRQRVQNLIDTAPANLPLPVQAILQQLKRVLQEFPYEALVQFVMAMDSSSEGDAIDVIELIKRFNEVVKKLQELHEKGEQELVDWVNKHLSQLNDLLQKLPAKLKKILEKILAPIKDRINPSVDTNEEAALIMTPILEALKRIGEIISKLDELHKQGEQAVIDWINQNAEKLNQFINSLPEQLRKILEERLQEIKDRLFPENDGQEYINTNLIDIILKLTEFINKLKQLREESEQKLIDFVNENGEKINQLLQKLPEYLRKYLEDLLKPIRERIDAVQYVVLPPQLKKYKCAVDGLKEASAAKDAGKLQEWWDSADVQAGIAQCINSISDPSDKAIARAVIEKLKQDNGLNYLSFIGSYDIDVPKELQKYPCVVEGLAEAKRARAAGRLQEWWESKETKQGVARCINSIQNSKDKKIAIAVINKLKKDNKLKF